MNTKITLRIKGQIKLLFILCSLLLSVSALAQTKTVKGTVVDQNGEAVIGATVTVNGNSKQGTVTDFNGQFTLQVPAGKKIKVSYIGYQTQVVGNLNNPKIVLEEDQNTLDDVIVVGYGALKQKNVTGAVEVINPEELKDLSVSSLSEALIGLSPSLHVSMPSTGRPGENATITIRSARDAVALIPEKDMTGAAVGANIDPRPLYVIDDFVYQDMDKGEEEFNNLDVDEVESITILKDAEAAVYGAYGAYGVILVKTKRGKAGKPRISYQTQLGWVDAVKHADMLDGYNYGRIYNAAKAAQVLQTSDNKVDRRVDFFQADELEAMKQTNYNLLDDYWSASLSQRHSINVNGGTEKATYFAGVTYQTQDGNIGKMDYNRWNYRAGITANINKYVKATLGVSGDDSRKNMHMTSSSGGSQEDYLYLLKNPSYVPDNINGYPIYHSGMANDPSFDNYYNYKSLYNSINNREQNSNSMSIQGSLEADFGFIKPLQGLRARLTYSRNVGNNHDNRICMENIVYRVKNRGGSGNHLYVTDPSLIIDNDPLVDYDETTLEGFHYTAFENLEQRILNSGQKSYITNTLSRNKSYQLNFMLMYGRKFGKHDVSGTFSIERGENESFNQYTKATHPLPFTDGTSNSLADDTQKEATWGKTDGGNLAYIGRFNYAYADKYLFQFLIRSQASAAKFAPENYWGAFPSFSAGWVVSEESWFPKEKWKIDFLKLRASWGIMGRDNVDAWRWLQLYAYNPNRSTIFGTDITKESARAFQLPEKSGTNRDLHWDKNTMMNFGVDMRMLDGRLSVSFDYYYNKQREMFATPNANFMPGTVGTYPAPENYSEEDLWGYEAIVGWRQRINKDMYVSARLGFSYDDNKVLKMYWDTDPKPNSMVYGERTDRGLWGYSCIGMFRTYQEIEEYFIKYNIKSYLGLAQSKVHPGMLIYEDIRGPKDENGNWTAPDGYIDENDIVQISKRKNNPYRSNLNLNFVWKSFSLNTTIQAEWGAYRMMPDMYKETFKSMETTNVSAMWNDMFIYEDVLDAQGRVIAQANPDGRWPNFGFTSGSVNTQSSTFWRMSAAEILIRNLTVAYTLPKNIVKSIGLNAVRFNMTIQNVLSLYNACPGGYWDNFAGTYGSYPVTRKITFGMNVTF